MKLGLLSRDIYSRWQCLVVLKAMVLVLAGEKYKPKLLAALSTAFRAFFV